MDFSSDQAQDDLMFLQVVALATATWLAPIPGALVEQDFNPPSRAWGAGHRGVDFEAEPATEVLAIGPGTVVFVGEIAHKPVVVVEHPTLGLRSTYEPVVAIVEVGQDIAAGDPLGETAAEGGHCAGHCLHLGLKGSGKNDYRNPLALINHGFAILKAPWS